MPEKSFRWSSVLVARLGWVLVTMFLVVDAAAFGTAMQGPTYSASSVVSVGLRSFSSGPPQPPDMGTERELASSSLVEDQAAALVGVAPDVFRKSASVAVPVDTSVLQVHYTANTPGAAQAGAQALAQAYLSEHAKSALAARGARDVQPAQVITPAVAPSSPSSPHWVINIVAGLVVGCAFGIVAAFVRDRLDGRVRSSSRLGQQIRLPVLGSVPVRRDARRRSTSSWDLPLQGYRALWARVLAGAGALDAGTVLVTSARAEGGSSQVAQALAEVAARSGRRVVLVRLSEDADGSQDGLALALAGHAGLDSMLGSTAVPGLRLLQGGADQAAIDDLLPGTRTEDLLAELTRLADLVVVDVPAALASHRAHVLARLADCTLLVAHTRASQLAAVRDAAAVLSDASGRVLGCVLTHDLRSRRSVVVEEPEPAGASSVVAVPADRRARTLPTAPQPSVPGTGSDKHLTAAPVQGGHGGKEPVRSTA